MKYIKTIIAFFGALAAGALFSSCLDDDDSNSLGRPTALVTVSPGSDGTFVMYLDDNTVLTPSNMKSSPFKEKEVRALVNYTEDKLLSGKSDIRSVHINWIDSIRTKQPVAFVEGDDSYGNDPNEIIPDWVTVAEDGYITMRIRTLWGSPSKVHVINLVTGVNPDDPNEIELRHNANGDVYGRYGDALVAFNLNGWPGFEGRAKIKLRWKSFTGERVSEFELKMRDIASSGEPEKSWFNKNIK